MINVQGRYPTKLLGCIFAGALGTILCGFLYIRIKLGFESKKQAKFMEDSELRLADSQYVQKLIDYGYIIPEKYMK